jgi:hypothetical protein
MKPFIYEILCQFKYLNVNKMLRCLEHPSKVKTMSEQINHDFEKSDIILANTLEEFQAQGVNQYVYGMAMVEIGLLALVKLGEQEDTLVETVRQFIDKSQNQLAPPMPSPRL